MKATVLHRRSTRPFELKSIDDTGKFSGYGSVFDVKDSYGDVVIKGAFANSLDTWASKGKLPKMLWQHDTTQPIGTWTKMVEDAKGLYVEGTILVEAGDLEKRAYAHLKAGSIDSLSIGYSLPAGAVEYSKEQDAYLLKKIDLWEISPVTFPANPEASIDAVKSAIESGPREFERFLRDAGMSRTQAKGLMSRGYEGVRDLRDADDEGLKSAASAALSTLRALRGTTKE